METLAPWAEPVLMTANELLALPEDGWQYELVEGRLVRMSPTCYEHGHILDALWWEIGRLVREHDLGTVSPPETGFLVSQPGAPDTVLAPDLAFIRAGRAPTPTSPEWRTFPRLAPDLVAEIASPSQGRAEMGAKAQRWLNAGVRLVWIVFPEARTVEVWRPGTPVRTLAAGDELSGEEVLSGFTYPVAHLFPKHTFA